MASKKQNNYSKLFGGLDLPKDRYDRNREGYVDDKANYHYITGMKDTGATPAVIPLKNADGSSNADLITLLANMDHAVNIQKRNAEDHEDARAMAFKANTDPNSEEADTTPDPMDKESYRRYMESQYQDDSDDDDEDPVQKFVHEFLLGLGDADQTIMFAVFGSGEEQKDAAAELNRTTQSVSRTIQRIKARLKKQLADELGYTGQDRTMPEK
ncbi:MAG: hypothetical protein ACI4D6_09925 [Chordicoccus sp.]